MKFVVLICVVAFAALGCTAGEAGMSGAIACHRVETTCGSRKIAITLITFNEQDFQIRVIDNATADGEVRFTSLGEASKKLGGIAGCNGGFFNRKPFAPVGLMVADGKRTGLMDPDSWMKGFLVVRNNHPTLESSESFRDSPDITDLLQSGPWLVRAAQSETDSSRKQVARRTFICHGPASRWAIGMSDSCTLAELSTALRSVAVRSVLEIQEALNLDGGPSTGLCFTKPSDEFYLPEKWVVRNFINVVPRVVP